MYLKKHIVVVLLGAGLAGGCRTDDPPTRAEIQAETTALLNITPETTWKAGQPAADPIADYWLATFDDVQLNALVTEAVTNNPDLRVAAARVEQSAQYVQLAKAALRPAINVFGTGGVNMGGGDALQVISAGASWEIDLWGRLRYARDAAEATYTSSQADFEFGRQSLAATVAKGWFTASETLLQRGIAEEIVAAAGELVSLAEKRHQVGIGNEQDVAFARANLGSFQDSLKQVIFAHSQAQRALELLVGRYPSAELATRHELARLAGPIPAGLPLQMLERRPDMIAAEHRVAAAFARVGEAAAARLPSITLNANIAGLASDILELKDDFENPTGGIGGKFLAPIYQGGALNARVELRTLEQKEAVAQYAQMALRALGDVENALAAAQTLQEREATLNRVVADNERSLELVRTSYRVGRADLRAVQQQLLQVQAARLTLLRVQSEQLSQRVNLHLSLGGSFAEPVQLAGADE